MANIDLSEELGIQESRWRGRIITLLALGLVAGAAAVAAYAFFFRGEEATERPTEDITVGLATINANLIISGIAEAQLTSELSFQSSGRVGSVDVEVGDVVERGDVLASLESEDLANSVASAQSSLAAAQLRLQHLLEGATGAELAAADQSVVSAEVALDRAERELDDLLDGPASVQIAAAEQAVVSARTARDRAQRDLEELQEGPSAAELAASEQAVAAAEAGLASAKANYEALLQGASSAEVEAAEASVASAEQTLNSAQIALDNARFNREAAESALRAAGASYCAKASDAAVCSPFNVPVSQGNVDALLAKLNDAATDAALVSLINTLIQTNSAYLAAANGVTTAQGAVSSAQAGLDAARASLNAANDGPDAADVDAAQAAIVSAEEKLKADKLKLDEVRDGADAAELATARDAVKSADASLASVLEDQKDLLDGADASDVAQAEDGVRDARAGLDAATARRDELYRGPTATEISQERQAVQTAALAVEAAQLRLKDAQIIAPFEGTVAAVNLVPGEFVGVAATDPAMVLLTPDALVLNMSIGETDYPAVTVDQVGIVIFDAIVGRPYAFRVAELGLSPTVTQGVVTYEVRGELVVPDGAPKPAPGMNARGQIITESRPNVVAIPPRAIRQRAADQVVDVRRNGTIEEQVVSTGLSDTTNVEILEGLSEGDVIVVPVLLAEGASGPAAQPTLPAGIR